MRKWLGAVTGGLLITNPGNTIMAGSSNTEFEEEKLP